MRGAQPPVRPGEVLGLALVLLVLVALMSLNPWGA